MKKWIAMLGCMAVLAGATAMAADTYAIDPVHSSVLFRILHMKTSFLYGRFNEISGAIVLDDANPAASSVQAEVKVDSVDTRVAARDTHLKSQSFFSAKEFPTITFKSTSVKKTGEGVYEVTGDMTLHGVTKPVTTTVNLTGQGKGPKGPIAGFETLFKIKRSDFGMNFMPDMVGDEVSLTVSVEADQK